MSIESIAVPARAPVTSRHARRSAVAIATGLAVVIAAFGCTRAWFDRRDALTATRTELQQTRSELAATRHDVAVAKRGLAVATAALLRAQADLAAKTAARDASVARLTGTNAQLSTLQGQLNVAMGDLVSNGAHLATLQQCVLGVARSLNQASVGDVVGLRSTLDGVASSCAGAGVKL
jgi:septal ring factor EnvC (AmiA/AmiB activator)